MKDTSKHAIDLAVKIIDLLNGEEFSTACAALDISKRLIVNDFNDGIQRPTK